MSSSRTAPFLVLTSNQDLTLCDFSENQIQSSDRAIAGASIFCLDNSSKGVSSG